MSRNEAQTRFELINPALFAKGWTTEHIKVEESTGGIVTSNGKARRRKRRTDYLLRQQETVEYVMTQKTGSRMPRANINHLLNMKVSTPSFIEQKRIVEIIEKKLSLATEIKKHLNE